VPLSTTALIEPDDVVFVTLGICTPRVMKGPEKHESTQDHL
jgi:hypothetical protein